MLKRIKVADLCIGMYVQEFCASWKETPFWRTSLMIDCPKTLTHIQTSDVKEVWIETSKGLDIEEAEPEAEEETAPCEDIQPQSIVVRRASFDDEIEHAKKLCAKGKAAVSTMFQEARMGQAVNTANAYSLVEEISSSVMRNPDALISLARLKNKDDYTYMHSVAVCALMIALAQKLKLDEKQTRDAGMAGLLHDIGKMMISQEILDKPGKLTDEEFLAVKEHPVEGHQLLLEVDGITEGALDVCLHHHERIDGNGYPHQLKGDEISLFARMGAVCDVYDAITSDRAYKSGWEPSESLRRMAEWSGSHFDPTVFQAFVKCIGIYPTGTLVRLKSGRVGVVIEQSDNSLLSPRIKVFFSIRSNAYVAPEIIDLGKLDDKIMGLEDAQKLGLKNVNAMWNGA
jgi:putative nucleotidyltransferase with HDIG domain